MTLPGPLSYSVTAIFFEENHTIYSLVFYVFSSTYSSSVLFPIYTEIESAKRLDDREARTRLNVIGPSVVSV